MKYMGSKNRIAKHLLPIMLEKRNGRTWVEPFVGGANMIDKVSGNRIGADANKYLIAMWKGLQKDIEKTINVLKIYLEEQGHKYKGQNEIINK